MPLILCFRAREKTRPVKDDKGRSVPTNIGWQPIAPSEIVHAMDLTCLLPPRADGVPTWKSEKIGEDFIIKLPSYLRPFIQEGEPLSREMGAAFARWAQGEAAVAAKVEADSALIAAGDAAAAEGGAALGTWWAGLSKDQRKSLGAERITKWKGVVTESANAEQEAA